MRQRYLNVPIITMVMLATLLPVLPASAQGNYSFRSTTVGTGTRQVSTNVWEITGETTSFNRDQSVFVMTRIFNISQTDNFQFKHILTGNGVSERVELSPTYYPRRNWWSEIYYWYRIDPLNTGDYQIASYVNIDGSGFRYLATKSFSVRDNRNYDYDYNYDYNNKYYNDRNYYDNNYNNYYDNYNYDNRGYSYDYRYDERYRYSGNYKYEWTQIGKNVRKTGDYSYEIVNQATNFYPNESVYVLTKTTNIRDIDTFRIKHDLYLNGNSYSKSMESGVLRPNYNRWEYNYTWANFGPVTNGNHEIRVYISINGGPYTLLDTKQFSISDYRRNNRIPDRRYDRPYDRNRDCYTRYDSYYCRNNRNYYSPTYSYDWTQTGNVARNTSGYIYEIQNQKSTFDTSETVAALTKISSIRGVDYLQVRHELYRDSTLITTNTSNIRYPRYSNWDYNYYPSDFGRLAAGNYIIKIFVSVNGGSFTQKDTKSITVNYRYYGRDNNDWRYRYDSCRTDYQYNYDDCYYNYRDDYYNRDNWRSRNYSSYQ